MKKPVSTRLAPLSSVATVSIAALALLSSCIFVSVDGDPSEIAWMDEVIHDNHAVPASFHHGDLDFELEGFLWSQEGRLKMEFFCAPDELEAYAASVRARVEQKIGDEGYVVVSVREIGEREWEYEYTAGRDCGRVTVEIEERGFAREYPYRLELRWTER